jgi:hypothetical protein
VNSGCFPPLKDGEGGSPVSLEADGLGGRAQSGDAINTHPDGRQADNRHQGPRGLWFLCQKDERTNGRTQDTAVCSYAVPEGYPGVRHAVGTVCQVLSTVLLQQVLCSENAYCNIGIAPPL